MFRYVASLFAGLALVFSMAAPAKASAISLCGAGTANCTFDFNGSTSGVVDPTAALGGPANWLVGYVLLMNQGFNGAGYAGGTANVFAVVVLHNNTADVISAADSGFGGAFSSASNLDPIDLTPVATGQIVGTPTGSGSLQFGGVGLVNNIAGNWLIAPISWFDPSGGPGGSTDSITVLGATGGPTAVPEPATMSLFGIGAAVTGYRRWRNRRSAA